MTLFDTISASAASDKKLIVWNMEIHDEMWSLSYNVYVNDLEIIDDLLLVCNELNAIQVHVLKTGKEAFHLDNGGQCRSMDFNKSKTILAVATKRNVLLWDYKNRRLLKSLNVGLWPVDLKFNPTGSRLMVALHEGKIIKIDISL